MDGEYILHGPEPRGPISEKSLGLLIYENLLKYCDLHHPAMIDGYTKEELSYHELLKKTCSLATALNKNGYNASSTFAISSENNLQFYIPIISAFYIGATVAPINHNYTPVELDHILSISKPKIIFCSQATSKNYVSLKKTHSFIERIIVIDAAHVQGDCAESLDDFITRSLRGVLINRFQPVEVNTYDDVAFILCSSGTTGLPKGVMQTHRNLLTRIAQAGDDRYPTLDPHENFLGILPFFHGFGLTVNLTAILDGICIIVLKRFEEEVFLKTIQDYKISSLYLAPPLVVFLAKSPLTNKYNLSHIKTIMCGGAPLGKETEDDIKQKFNIENIRQAYGLTEATLAVVFFQKDDPNLKKGSSGQVMPYMRLAVRHPETGQLLGPNKAGEIVVKGPMVMKGYCGNPKATVETFTKDGWLLTGDVGYYDDDKYFFIVDRIKELIKYKGFQVAPAELEAMLLSHPKIKEAGVVGLPNEEAGELPLAFVTKRPGCELTAKEVEDFIASNLSPQKRLRGGVIFIDAIPKNPSGKILRRELRELLKKHKSKL